jgi:malonyl-CoA O-methyltransferase
MLPQIFRRRPQILPPQEAYAIWAESYPPRPHNPLMEVEQATVAPVIAACAASAPRRALDVGTGSGRYLPLLAATGASLVCGIDFSMPMLSKHTSGHPRICADACRLPFANGSFDLISSSLMMGDIADLARCIAELSRVLAAGGHLVYSDFHPSWADGKWRRTFEGPDGRQFELACCPHTITAHLAHLDRYGLDVPAVHEARFPGSAAPAVAVFHAVKRA